MEGPERETPILLGGDGQKESSEYDLEANAVNTGSGVASKLQSRKPTDSSLSSFNSSNYESLGADAYHGLAGQFARVLEPFTEAGKEAMLIQFLAAAGSAFGRGPYFKIGADAHFANLFLAIVGKTGGGKGTSWSYVREVFELAGIDLNQVSGLSSGEGLVKALEAPEGDSVAMLVHEPELASLMSVSRRDGTTITSIVRQLWDSDRAQVIVKNKPLKVTGAHLVIVAHTTPVDLQSQWQAKDSGNGFGNRFLWIFTQRSKLIAFPQQPPKDLIDPLVAGLRQAVATTRARGQFELRPSEEVREAYEATLPALQRLVDEEEGIGGMLARYRPIIWRIALIYAVLDGAETIELAHLRAAFAWFHFSRWSLKESFGAPRRTDSERLVYLLNVNQGRMTRTDLSNALNRDWTSQRIGSALESLEDQRVVRLETEKTAGRSVTVIVLEASSNAMRPK